MTNFVLVQKNSWALNIKNNFDVACEIIEKYKNHDNTIIIFPENFLIGYPFGDTINKFPKIVDDNIKFLEKLAQKTTQNKVIIGFIQKDNEKLYNSLAILSDGKIEKIIKKSDIKNNSILEPDIITIDNLKIGIITCELGYNDKNFDINSEKIKNIENFIETKNPDILLNCAASISRTNKEHFKHEFLSKIAQNTQLPLIYVNTVGANEFLSFDGASRVFDKTGKIIARAKSFEEDILEFSFNVQNRIEDLPTNSDKSILENKFDLNYENDLERTYLSVVQSIKDYFQKTGFKRAVLGLSGGLDSTVNAVLLCDALGAKNVCGVSMPSSITTSESKNDAVLLAQNLGLNFLEIPIKNMFEATNKTFDTLFRNVENNWKCRYNKSFTSDNIQARSRATILWGIANEFEACLPIATSDKSELYMGYATINGDMAGGFAPIADITKTKLFALANWINKNHKIKNVIPQSIIDKRPGAELAINPETNKPLLAEEALMPYEFMDEVIWRIENFGQTVEQMKSEKFWYEIKENISAEQKQEWLNKFFRRMSFAHFKWGLLPLSPIIDWNSINTGEYFQPIISSKIEY